MCKLLATVGGLLDSSTKTVKNFGGGSKPVATKVGGAAGYYTIIELLLLIVCFVWPSSIYLVSSATLITTSSLTPCRAGRDERVLYTHRAAGAQ